MSGKRGSSTTLGMLTSLLYPIPWSLFVFSLPNRQLRRKRIFSSCDHTGSAFLSTLIIAGREKLVVSCTRCDDLKLVDPQTGKWSTAFTGCKTRALCPGGSGTIFIQKHYIGPILQLDATSSVFKCVRTLHTDMLCMTMCYIPPPVNALVLCDCISSKLVALSVESGAVMWQLQRQEGGNYDKPNDFVNDYLGLLFHPEHNVLFVADGERRRVLVVDPRTGVLIKIIDLPSLGSINALGLYKDQIVMFHHPDSSAYKISCLKLSG